MHSIRTKITAVTVAAILASLIAAAAAGFFTVGQEVSSSSAEKMHLMSEVAQQSLDSYLNDIEQSVGLTSQIATDTLDGILLVECGANKPAESRTDEQTKRLDTYLSEHTTVIADQFGKVAEHAKGVLSYYYCIEPNISASEHGFLFTRTGKVGFVQEKPVDVSQLDPQDMEHNTWYFTVIQRGAPCWVGPYRDIYTNNVPVVSYISPVYRSGILVGLIGMDILLDTMIEQIASLKVYDTGYAFLLDQDGQVIYHPHFNADGADKSSLVFDASMFCKTSSANDELFYDIDGVRWQMSYSTLINGMKLVVTAPASEVAASWNRLVGVVPIIGLVILALFIPLALFATRAITKPLQQLTAGAHRLSMGDYEIELDYHGNDEVGELTDAFRHLQDHLRVYTSNLSDASFSDELTGMKNEKAFGMYAAQINDSVKHATDVEESRFALVVIDCLDIQRMKDDFGPKWADANVQTVCKLICNIYSSVSVFRVSEERFVVFLQGRNYANREELFCDFDIWANEINAEATEPWLQIHVAMGMATYQAGEDDNVAQVLERAVRRTEQM
ncbi:MAG: cache domain-containing protein [Coriobacteriales bacterium]|nr:cache domain-containing protein [Coriobacteriales bacterium]